MSFTTELVRNVAITGHGGTGKTTLFEHILFTSGLISKAETSESGKTVSDYTQEEIERKISIYTTMAHVKRAGKKINFFDTPGSSDFSGNVSLALRAAEFILFAVDAQSGAQIETVKIWRGMENDRKSRGVFITHLDEDRADFKGTLDDIQEKLKTTPVPITIPMGSGADFKGIIDVLHKKAWVFTVDGSNNPLLEKEVPIPSELEAEVNAAREELVEAAAEGSDALMEQYIEKGTLSDDEVQKGLIEALLLNKFVPVFSGAGTKNSGIVALLDFIAEVGPSPAHLSERAKDTTDKECDIAFDSTKPLLGLVIKTSYDQFSGKLSWVKVVSGKLSADSEIMNVRENKKEKVGKLYTCQGKKLEECASGVLFAGDVGIIAKAATLKTNTTISAGDTNLRFLSLKLPEPAHSVAVNAASKKDDDKLGEFLVRASEEDKTFRYAFNAETKETVISGMGELQINIILEKIKGNQKIEVETRVPRIAYRETITKKASAEYTHKKQTGGHGQYGKVLLEIAPKARGEGYKFENKIFGGAVPKNYIPGVEKGIVEGMAHGTMAQYPVVDVEVAIVDGKYHPVDSSELSFKLASRNAFREAMKQAGATLLEPVMNLTVFVEDKYLGDVMSDLSGKRGKILGQDSTGGIAEIRAEVPQAELLRYSIDLRSITSGTGSFSLVFSHYVPISGRIAEDVIKAAEAFKVQEEDE